MRLLAYRFALRCAVLALSVAESMLRREQRARHPRTHQEAQDWTYIREQIAEYRDLQRRFNDLRSQAGP